MGRLMTDYEETANRRFHEEKQLENDLADRLFRLYDYAATDWDAVGLEWFELFENQDDASVCKRLLNHQVQGKHRSFDEVRTVVLAIDEAKYLLKTPSRDSINWCRLLRRSLQKATVMIRNAFGERASLFAVLVDTNSKVTNFVRPAQQDHSSRGKTNDDSILFPPFVLTHTMDIRFEAMMKGGVQNPASSREEASQRGSSSEEKTQQSHSKTAFFQGIVAREYRAAWPVFVAMGRPLWDRVKADDHSAGAEATGIIQLAADKILGGFSAAEPDSFREESLFGIASALCRLGLRPSSWSPFASRAIAEFMIVLLHVNYTHDQLLVSYSSDPILTFGATRVWYQSASMSDVHSLLSTYILPQLSKLLRQDVMDTGEVGEIVSRMLLLLAMDATGAVMAKHTDRLVSDRAAFQYAGEFLSVKTFLEVLHGHEDITVRDGFMISVTDHQVVDMLKVLHPWKLGFSHFVQVSEQPTKTMLWAMLARRTAGIFPRNCKGVDLFIPMFKGEDVSMIVVQVKNVADYDKAFPYSASIGMRPSFVNKFKPSELSDVVRIYMSLRGRDATTRSQFYLVDEGIRHSPRLAAPSIQSYALCLHGLGPWTALREAPISADDKFFPVVSQGVATFESDEDYSARIYRANVRAHRERCRYEFQRPCIGCESVVRQLLEYITACAEQYAAAPTEYVSPLVSIVQSSGAGKSRLLRELAYRTKDDPNGSMRLLYTCVRPADVSSSGYPEATPCLRDYLFPLYDGYQDEEWELVAKLVRLYDYTACQWKSVGKDWFSLLDNQEDEAICERIMNFKAPWRYARSSAPRLVVFAIDEARYLLPSNALDPEGWLERLHDALAIASEQIRARYGASAGLFVVLADTSCTILVRQRDNDGERFAPFVLTQTFDVRFETMMNDTMTQQGLSKLQFLRELVARDYKEAWPALVAMGRPLWDRVNIDDFNASEESTEVIQLAADNLLGGLSAMDPRSFRAESLFGAASMLCRLGLRPSSWSPLASQAVAGFMATLVHVNATEEQRVALYTSEPVLAFGAARVWYQSTNVDNKFLRLSTHILPHFRSLLVRDLIDTGGDRGDLVSRILLLLAIDATGAVVSPSLERAHARAYAGRFYSVEVFLDVLYGDYPIVVRDDQQRDVTSSKSANIQAMKRRWRDWIVGFGQFVEMSTAPSDVELWTMLARRAAGVVSRCDDAVDFCIPIFHETDVSAIFVQCRNDASPPLSPVQMRLTGVLKNRAPSDVLRIWINTSDVPKRRQYYLVDESDDAESYALCLEGIHPWEARSRRPQRDLPPELVPVLSHAAAVELKKLAEPYWDPMRLVEESLACPGYRDVMHPDEVRAIASRPMIESLLAIDNDED